jgi:hypothetical protein
VIVAYRGKPYRLLWGGPTRHGTRAKLARPGGGPEFWVDAGDLAPPEPGKGNRVGRRRGAGR